MAGRRSNATETDIERLSRDPGSSQNERGRPLEPSQRATRGETDSDVTVRPGIIKYRHISPGTGKRVKDSIEGLVAMFMAWSTRTEHRTQQAGMAQRPTGLPSRSSQYYYTGANPFSVRDTPKLPSIKTFYNPPEPQNAQYLRNNPPQIPPEPVELPSFKEFNQHYEHILEKLLRAEKSCIFASSSDPRLPYGCPYTSLCSAYFSTQERLKEHMDMVERVLRYAVKHQPRQIGLCHRYGANPPRLDPTFNDDSVSPEIQTELVRKLMFQMHHYAKYHPPAERFGEALKRFGL